MAVVQVEGDLPIQVREELARAQRVAVDTETSGLDWRTDVLQLCQLSSPQTGTFLLKHVSQKPPQLTLLLEDAAVVKVFHHAPFDLRFLEAQWGIRAHSTECTKVASRLIDPDLPAAMHSLQSLLDRHLGVRISKGAVRTSDWGAPALSREQAEYAAADVEHLLALAAVLRERLRSSGKEDLFDEVCAYLPTAAHLQVAGYPDVLSY